MQCDDMSQPMPMCPLMEEPHILERAEVLFYDGLKFGMNEGGNRGYIVSGSGSKDNSCRMPNIHNRRENICIKQKLS